MRYSLCPPTRNQCCCVYGLVTVPPVKTDVWGKGGLSVAAEDTSKKCTNKIIKPPGKKIHEPGESPFPHVSIHPVCHNPSPVNSTIILRSSQHRDLVQETNNHCHPQRRGGWRFGKSKQQTAISIFRKCLKTKIWTNFSKNQEKYVK